METQTRRSDRWEAEAPAGTRNGWAPVGAVLVLAGYAVGVIVAGSARGSLSLSDELEIALVALAPSLASLGAVCAFVATRRPTLRALAWVVLALGVLLVIATIVVVATVLLALRELS